MYMLKRNYENIREVIDSNEAARLLNVTRETIRKLFNDGVIEGFRLKRRFRIYLDSLPNYENLREIDK